MSAPLEKCPACGKEGRGKYWRKKHLCQPPGEQPSTRSSIPEGSR